MRFAGSLDPVWQADVAAKIDGRVEKVYVNEGDKVTAGTVLAHLEQTEQTANLLSAKGSLMDAQTTLERAERELQRYQALYEKGAVSEQTVDNYRFARNNAQGKLSEAQGVWDNMQDKLSGASVTAPQDLSLIHIPEPTRLGMISYAVFCLKKKNQCDERTG